LTIYWHKEYSDHNISCFIGQGLQVITSAQLRAARALLGIDQRRLAGLSGLSLPTIQRMETSEGTIRGNVDSLMKLVAALDRAGIELIGDNATSVSGGRGVRLKVAPATAKPRLDDHDEGTTERQKARV
jgi:transcriptional regulator with XRE-family HTH domain